MTSETSSTETKTHEACVVAVASLTGGCGKTFLATSLASILGSRGQKTLLVDLDLHGDAAVALQLRPQRSLYDGLYGANGKRFLVKELEERLTSVVVGSDLGFDLIAGPRDPVKAARISDADVSRVVKTVRKLYDVVVIDTSPSPAQLLLSVVAASDVGNLVATLDVPSLKNLKTLSESLSKEGFGIDKQRLILNKVAPDLGFDIEEVQETFDNRFVSLIPLSNAVSRAMNAGMVMPQMEPKSEVTKQLLAAARSAFPDPLSEVEGDEASPRRRLRFGRKEGS